MPLSLIAILVTGLFLFTAIQYRAFAAAPWTVNNVLYTDDSLCTVPGGRLCQTIQAAVTGATGGDTINVAAGTYAESVTVDKGVSIIGAGNTLTIINPATDSNGFTITAAAVSGVTIQNLKVTLSTTGVDAQAIRLEGADNVTITGNRIETTGNKGVGIFIANIGFANSDNLSIDSNFITIADQSTGILAEGGSTAQTGWSITGNTVTANLGNPLELYDVTASTVSGNTLTTTTSGGSNVIWNSELAAISNLIFTNNILNGSLASQVVIGTDLKDAPLDPGNAFTGSITTVTITGNEFNNWDSRGLRLGKVAGVGTVSGVTANNNKFLKTGEALKNLDAATVNAENNYWNSPTPNFATTVVTTGGAVDYNPWWINSAMTLDNTDPEYTDDTIQASSTIKGQTIASLGTPGGTIGTATAGAVTINGTQAADTSNAGAYITLFDKNYVDAATKVVKYATGADTSAFATDTAYANEAITDQDFFIVQVTAADTTTIQYYKIVVTIDSTPPAFAATTKTVDSDADGTVDQIVVDFNENVNLLDASGGADGTAQLAVSGCTIADGDYTVTNGTTVTLDVTGCPADSTTITPTVTYTSVGGCAVNGSICDVAGNQMVNGTNVVPLDGAPPVILGRTYTSSGSDGTVDRINLTFSENVLWNGLDLGQFDIVNNNLVNYDSNGIPDAFMGGSGTQNITLSTSGTANLTGTSGMPEPTVQYTQSVTAGNRIKDAAGNDMVSELGPVSLEDDADPFKIGVIYYADSIVDGQIDQVTLSYSEEVSYTYQDSDWTATPNGLAGFDVTSCAFCTSVNSLVLDATANANLTGVSGNAEPQLDYVPGNLITDVTGNSAANFGPASLVDYAAPYVYLAKYKDNNGDGEIDGAVLTFTEATTFTMAGGDWDFGTPGDIGMTGDYTAGDCAGSGSAVMTCTDLANAHQTADAGETGGITDPIWDYTNNAGNFTDGANAMGNVSITLADGAAPAYAGARAVDDTTVQIQMTEHVSYVNFGAASAWTATGLTSSNVAVNGGDSTVLDLTVAPLGDTAYAAADFAYIDGSGGAEIDDTYNNKTASFASRPILDGQAPVLVGIQPVYAVTESGATPATTSNIWYYYPGHNLRLKVVSSEPLLLAEACVRSITGDNTGLTCSPVPGDFAGVDGTDFITSIGNVGNVYEFNSDIGGLFGPFPSQVAGYPMNIALQDTSGNWGYGAGGAEAFTAVFNIVPTAINTNLGGATTDWAGIDDYTAATNVVFENTVGGSGTLSFAGPINLTAPATITALQSLSTNVITGGDDPSGAAVLGINSAALAAFDVPATLTAHMPTADRPGLYVYDNAGAFIGSVPNDQSSNITIGGDTLGTFVWNAGAQTLTWDTNGFSSFGTDSTPPTLTDGNISIAGGTGTGLAYIVGDIVTVTWDNSGAGDNNGADFSHATANLSGFGGGATVAMTDTTACGGTAADLVYEACHTIVDDATNIDGTNINAAVTAYDLVGNPITVADTTNATVDNIAPIISTPGSLAITLDNNSNSIANVSDTVTYTNAVLGAADGDTITVNLTTLTGTAAATQAGSPYTVVLGTLTGTQNFVQTVTDNAGNVTTGNTAGLAVDNRSLLTAVNVTPGNSKVSTSTSYTFAFTTNSIWPANGKIEITFPAGFTVSSLDTKVADNLSNVDGVLTAAVAGQVVTVTRDGSGAAVPASTAVAFRLGTGTNKGTVGASGTFTFETTTSLGAGIDINDAVTGFTLTAATVACNDGIDNDSDGLIDFPADLGCMSATDTDETNEVTGGGGGGGGGSGATSSSNNTTSSVPATIGTVTGDQTYGSPLQLKPENITVDTDNNTATAPLTGDGTLTLKPNSGSTITATFPPNTDVTGPADWNGIIDPPVVKSLSLVSTTGDAIEGTKDKLMRDDVAAIIKVGANVPLQFSNEVTLNIPVALPDGSVVLLYTSLDGVTWTPAGEGVVQNGVLVVKTDHFTYFAVAMTGGAQLITTPVGATFTDIVGHWAQTYITKLADLGIVSGKTANMFAPDDRITRAELTKIAMKSFNLAVNPAPGSSPFGDVSLTEWYAPYIIAARDAGIVKGYAGDVFSPNGLVNRAEALKIILGAAGLNEVAAEKLFEDVSTQDWFAGFVTYAVHNGVVSGRTSTTFAPGDSITRAEVAKIVVKVMDLK